MSDHVPMSHEGRAVSLATIAREWTNLGFIGFGGPPTHIVLLRRLCVQERHWLEPDEFEDAIAAMNLLPGPASTQLAIYCAWKLRGVRGAIIGGLGDALGQRSESDSRLTWCQRRLAYFLRQGEGVSPYDMPP